MGEVVCKMVAADRGQPSRDYDILLSTGKNYKVSFVRDHLTGSFLWRYEQDEKGNPTNPEQREVLQKMRDLFVPKPGMEKYHGSYMIMLPYDELPKDTTRLGYRLSMMDEKDFEVWLEEHSAFDPSLLEVALDAMKQIRRAPRRQRLLRDELEKLYERGDLEKTKPTAPAAPAAPAAAPVPAAAEPAPAAAPPAEEEKPVAPPEPAAAPAAAAPPAPAEPAPAAAAPPAPAPAAPTPGRGRGGARGGAKKN